jgi:hypothetical protein
LIDGALLGSLDSSLEGLALTFELRLLLGVADLLGWSDGFLLGWSVRWSDFIDGWALGSLDGKIESVAVGGMLRLLLATEEGLLLGINQRLLWTEGTLLGAADLVGAEVGLTLEATDRLGVEDGSTLGVMVASNEPEGGGFDDTLGRDDEEPLRVCEWLGVELGLALGAEDSLGAGDREGTELGLLIGAIELGMALGAEDSIGPDDGAELLGTELGSLRGVYEKVGEGLGSMDGAFD